MVGDAALDIRFTHHFLLKTAYAFSSMDIQSNILQEYEISDYVKHIRS